MARLTAYGRRLQAVRAATPTPSRPPIRLERAGVLPEYIAKRIIAAAGIRVPEGALARDAAQAQDIAARIGYPVVLKAQASELAHKSDAGGVMLALADSGELRAAWARLHGNLERVRPGLEIEGVLVEKMAEPGLEMFVGARRDPGWGPVVAVGLGGVWIEALEDLRLLPPSLGEAQVIAEIRRLKGARLLAGVRGAPPLDEHAVAGAVVLVGELMRANPGVSEIDINPLVVYPAGSGVQALDALIVASPS